MTQYQVRAVHCDHRSSDEEVYQALYYRDHVSWFHERYIGQYILLQDDEVR